MRAKAAALKQSNIEQPNIELRSEDNLNFEHSTSNGEKQTAADGRQMEFSWCSRPWSHSTARKPKALPKAGKL